MKRFTEVAVAILNAILGEDTPPSADFVREVRHSPFVTL
jgi:hypothetical protein